jgi:GNAT superfamily N-acetyltransferase
MPVPLWTGDWMQWELFGGIAADRELLVAAYDRARLVGVLPAKPVDYHYRGDRFRGTFGSYFSVHPDYENHGVPLKLQIEQRRRHRRLGYPCNTGFVYVGSDVAKGKDFWLKQSKLVMPIRKIGLWARPLDHTVVSRFELSRRDRWGTHLLRCLHPAPKDHASRIGLRPYQEGDLHTCLRLAQAWSDTAEFGHCWDRPTLSRQLQFKDVVRTLVVERAGRVAGFVTYGVLELLGRRPLTAGVIDFLCLDALPFADRKRALSTVLFEMRRAGVHVALALRSSCLAKFPMLANGFIPLPREYWYVAQMMGQSMLDAPIRRLCVQWR